jgi:hypothetical protein
MLSAERLMDAAQVAAQLPHTEPPANTDTGVVAPIFNLHNKPSEPAPMRVSNEGPSALDLLMFKRAKTAGDQQI